MGISVHDAFVDPLGNPLGLARVLGLLSIKPTIVDLAGGWGSVSDTVGGYIIPDSFSFFRVTVVGAGGSGTSVYSATGGGLARSAILPAKKGLTISYVAAAYTPYADTTASSIGRSSSARFNDVFLMATGGRAGSAGTLGGAGSNGADNFNGGAISANTSGTGAAGTSANGADSRPLSVGSGINAAGDAGGSGAYGGTGSGLQGGGGGWMGYGGAMPSLSTASVYQGGSPADLDSRNAKGLQGGGWGGGAGKGGDGGYGGVRIELW